MRKEYNHNSHSKYLIKLHFVFSVKYRKKLLVKSLNNDMLQIIYDIAKEKGFSIDTMQSDVDHLHILVDCPSKLSAFNVAHCIKQKSTNRIYKRYSEELKKHFWNENTFWSDGYFVCSTGDASVDTIHKYIDEQG